MRVSEYNGKFVYHNNTFYEIVKVRKIKRHETTNRTIIKLNAICKPATLSLISSTECLKSNNKNDIVISREYKPVKCDIDDTMMLYDIDPNNIIYCIQFN
jgi:hypothetical protein